jgi:sigma-B regulation protein RsbU (phosphoserine phosphatase)
MGNSIATRLIVLLTGCLAAIFVAGMALDYYLSRAEILERLAGQSQDTIQAAVTDMENWLDAVEESTLLLSRILQQRDYSNDALQQMLKNIVEHNEDIFGAAIALNPERLPEQRGFAPYYFHRDGILSYADLATGDYNYRQQPWFVEAAADGRPVWVEPYFDEGGGEVLMTTFSVPVYRFDAQGERFLHAVVTADIGLADLHAYLSRLRLGEHGNAVLLSRRGTILGSRNRDNILRHYSQVIDHPDDLATWRQMFEAALGGQLVSRQLECPATRGRCNFRLGQLTRTGWPVGVIYSQREMLAPLHRFQLKTLLLGLATLLLMSGAIYLVTRRLTRPLLALADASDQIAHGQLDVPLPQATGSDELAVLVNAFGAMKRDLRHHINQLEAATATRSRLEAELDAARAIQMSLLPSGGEACEELGFCNLWARVLPARSVGGDLYCYWSAGDRLWLAIGDVSDKGVAAALFMAKTISLIPQLTDPATNPARALVLLNNALEAGNENCMFVTLFLGSLDREARTLRFASAGHLPPTLLRDGSARSIDQQCGPALGLAPDIDFPLNRLQLQAGDRLALFTDGIEEAFNASGDMFGLERFNRGVVETAGQPLADAGMALLNAIDDFTTGTPQSDDIALVLLQLMRPDSVTRNFDRGVRLATRALQWLGEEWASRRLPGDAGAELQLVLEEILTNIDSYADLDADARISVTLHFSSAEVELAVSDEGRPFNPLAEGARAPLGEGIDSADVGGLGVHLIAQLTDSQVYERQGERNVLRVTKNLPGSSTTDH